MALISLGSVTIVAMILWFLTCVAEMIKPVNHAKIGLAAMWLVAVEWQLGVIV